MDSKNTGRTLSPYISPLGAMALSMGTSIGWGSLVVTSNTYLSQAGPAGSIIGLLIGAAVMLVIARNYHYMINCFPEAGGTYAFSRETFGNDYGFLVSWFLMLTYAAMFWANVTSLPLFSRFFIGDVFRCGRLYTIFGYDVYLGEALLTTAAIALTLLLCSSNRKITIGLMKILAVAFTVGITVCFIAGLAGHGETGFTYDPAYLPDSGAISQIIFIACISPWAFIGFENISHASEEFSFPRSRIFRLLTITIIITTALYVFVLLLSVSAYPPEFSGWREYIAAHGELSGIKGLPAFYAANYYLGRPGVVILILALLALVLTSLIGNTVALSRLLYAIAGDGILPSRFASLNKHSVPGQAMLLVALLSIPIPFIGRTAIGWIVDVTTIGATLIYGFVSASTIKIAIQREDRLEIITGRIGLVTMIIIACYLLLPNLFSVGSMEKETYFLFVVWGILGFIFFRGILRRDREGKFGKSIVVWIALLSLVLLISLIWMSQSMMSSTNQAMTNIHEHYVNEGGVTDARMADEEFVEAQMETLRANNARTIMVATGMFAFALVILLTNYSFMNRRARESEEALGHARAIAYTDPLTGVKNKRSFTEQSAELDDAIIRSGCQDFSVAVFDVNGLKHVNDTYGHKAGDEYIRSACHLICVFFQHSPVFRIGGDEFVAILTGSDHEHRDSIMSEFDKKIIDNISANEVVISAGISDYVPGTDPDFHAVFERADALMYQRKKELKELGARSR